MQGTQATQSGMVTKGWGGKEAQRMKCRTDPCITPAPHLVDKLPDILLPQVVHHVLGMEEAVRCLPAQHITKKVSVPSADPLPCYAWL